MANANVDAIQKKRPDASFLMDVNGFYTDATSLLSHF